MTSLSFQTYRLQLVREQASECHKPDPILDRPAAVSGLLSPLLADLDREHFVVLALDARNRPIGAHTVSVGTLSASLVHPREVFKFAILANASSLILAHNHPSGDTAPSQDDIELTRRLVQAGELIGIQVLDHLVIGDGDFFSLKEQNLM
jgi:DNA repair protein RadC